MARKSAQSLIADASGNTRVSMRIKRIVLAIILALQVVFIVRSAVAQGPPHQPGTIYYTPECW